jgi:methionyl-tRNA formyltransferase
MYTIDLYLGSDLGMWALQQVSTDTTAIGQVVTFDTHIAEYARQLGVTVQSGDNNIEALHCSDAALSIHYPRILKPAHLARYRKAYNLHPGYLPWGRGFYPIFWALWEQTPAGATLHEMSAGVDQGPIVAQTQVAYSADDTGGTLFQRVREAEKALFLEYWAQLVAGHNLATFPQCAGGSYHSRKDFLAIKTACDWENMSSIDLVRLIRCLTFPGYPGVEITLGQSRFAISLEFIDQHVHVR